MCQATTKHTAASAVSARIPERIASLCWDRVIRIAVITRQRPPPKPCTP